MQKWALFCDNFKKFLRFSLFSVDSGDQKMKTFYTFFGFSAFRPQIGATYITWNWVTIIGQTKNNHGREAAAFLKGRLLELATNNNNYGREARSGRLFVANI